MKWIREPIWQRCPRCNSSKTQYHGTAYWFLLGFLMTSVCIWLVLILIGIPGVAIGIIIMAISPFLPKKMVCKDCKFSWKYQEKELAKS